MARNSVVILALALAACDAMSVGNRTQRSGEVTMSGGARATQSNSSETPEGVGAPMAWRVEQGAAFYGAANQPPAFALRCDPATRSIVFERAGKGTSLILSAGGSGATLGTRDVGNDRVQARTGMGDAVLDAMARPQAQVAVGGGGETLTIPGGVAIRRVVDFCRNPPPPPEAQPAADNAMAPATPAGNAMTPAPSVSPGSAPVAIPQALPRPAGNRDTAARPSDPAPR
jgi:hypothetical protein